MSDNSIYSKAIPFTIVAAIVILTGTIITVFIPMMMKDMHPKLEALEPYTAAQLAGRNIYQAEGCFNCHTQTVRPLKADVIAYGDYSKAGENYYERPFLWGSKRTGPDLARIGEKYPDEWHLQHFVNPQAFYPASNMPAYTWLAETKVDVALTEASMKALGYPYTQDDVNELKSMTELEALVAYMQVIGTAVPWESYVAVNADDYEGVTNPLNGNQEALRRGQVLFSRDCTECHGVNGEGTDIASAMEYLASSDAADGYLFVAIANGTRGLMPEYINRMTKNDVWSLVLYARSLADAANQ